MAWPVAVSSVFAAAFARTKDPSEIIGADVVDEEVRACRAGQMHSKGAAEISHEVCVGIRGSSSNRPRH
jgi:hypothetical protein